MRNFIFIFVFTSILTLFGNLSAQIENSLFIVMFDESGSIGKKGVEKVKKHLPALERLLFRNNKIMFHRFGNENIREISPSDYKDKNIYKVLGALKSHTKFTALHDGVYSATEYGEIEGRKYFLNPFIILFTDGFDEGSSTNMDLLLDKIAAHNVPILAFPISGYQGINEDFFP